MKKYLKMPLYVASLALMTAGVASCSDDEGPGIPPGDEEKLFRRFYCERPTGEQFGHHSGLGLSISEKIVTGLGGVIYASNRKDGNGKICGARLVVILPLNERNL